MEHLSQVHSLLDSGPHPKARHSVNINGHMAVHIYDFLHFSVCYVRGGVFPLDGRLGSCYGSSMFQVVSFYLLFILYYFR